MRFGKIIRFLFSLDVCSRSLLCADISRALHSDCLLPATAVCCCVLLSCVTRAARVRVALHCTPLCVVRADIRGLSQPHRAAWSRLEPPRHAAGSC